MKNILFLSFIKYKTINVHDFYADILRNYVKDGHHVYVVTLVESKYGIETSVLKETGCDILQVKIGGYFNVNSVRKGITLIEIEHQVITAIKKYWSSVKFDMVLYATPPISFAKVIQYIKKRDNAVSYLMLKDIFPQNAVDLGMMSKTGIKSVLYKYFRKQEKQLYCYSNRIGCMSQANVDYVLKHNPEISSSKLEICPNCIEPQDMSISPEERNELRRKYNIPLDKVVFVYGGNLGKPQGIPFIIECLKKQKKNSDAYFLIVGGGTEFEKLQEFFNTEKPENMKLMSKLPKDDYDRMVAACDVGLIFLDHRFTIPNFPSRLLSYMQAKLPVLAATDPNTDIGEVISQGGFGWWCESNDTEAFSELVEKALEADLNEMKTNETKYLMKNYTANMTYKNINKSIGWK